MLKATKYIARLFFNVRDIYQRLHDLEEQVRDMKVIMMEQK